MNDTENVRTIITDNLLHRVEWDEPPELCMILTVMGLPYIGRSLIPNYIWTQGPVPHVLETAADMIEMMVADKEFSDARKGSGCQGIFLFSEAWAVVMKKDDPTNEETMKEVRAHRLSVHPKRIEVKTAIAIMANGDEFFINLARGSSDVEELTIGDKDRSALFSENNGTVPEQLRRLRNILCDDKLLIR